MFKIIADDLPRFMVCNGSRLMVAAMPPSSDDTSARDEGTAAHHMATQAFRGNHHISELIDRKAPNGVYMTSDMADHVGEYVDILNCTTDWQFGGVEIDTSHHGSDGTTGGEWLVSGRADAAQYQTRLIRIVDFKYGWRIIEPENNWTLISHAIGFYEQNYQSIDPQSVVQLCIYQPRPFHADGALRIWEITLNQLFELATTLKKTLDAPTDLLRTSPHCHKCRALVPCPAARQAEMNALDMIETAYSDQIDNDELAWQLDNLNRASDIIKSRLEAMQEFALHRVKTGQIVPNYSAEMGYGNTRWKEGITAAVLKAVTGKDLSSPKLVTPAQAERQGVNEATISSLTERLPSGTKLVRVKANKKAERLLGKKG